MRKKTQTQVGYALGGAAILAISDMLIQAIEQNADNQPFRVKWNPQRTLLLAVGGAIGGALIGTSIYQNDLAQRNENPFNTNQYLKKVVQYYKLENQANFGIHKELGDWLRLTLYEKLSDLLIGTPHYNGSVRRKIGLIGSDMDIILPYENTSSHKDLYAYTYETISQLALDDVNISYKKDANSIGVKMKHLENEYNFDIVSAKASPDYFISGCCTIIDRSQTFWNSNISWKATNMLIPNEELVNQPHIREAIMLMRIYQKVEGWNIPNILIQKMCLRALSNTNTYSTYNNFITVAAYIAHNIQREKWIDNANSNNNLLSSMSQRDKNTISRQINSDLAQLTDNKCYLEDIFQLSYSL